MVRLFYRVYRLASAIRHRLPRTFTRSGQLVLAGMLIAGSIGADMDRTVAYQAFALQFCLLASALVCRRFFRADLRVQRNLPRFASVGHPFCYTVAVSNASAKTLRDLELFEDLSDPRPTRQEFGERWRSSRQRLSGKLKKDAHYQDLEFRRAIIEPVTLPTLTAHGSAEAPIQIHPLRRGVLRFEGVSIGRPEPLGLARGFKRLPLPQSVLILPRRYSLPSLSLGGTRKYQRGGIALAASVGESEEFITLRDYRPGDPLRHIHWRSWARTGQPIVREFQDEFVPRHALVLDTFASAAQDEAFEEAVSLAASFACTVEAQESLLDLLFVGPQAICFSTGRGLGQAQQALEILASVQRNPEGSFKSLHRLVREHASLVCSCVCVFVAWNDERRAVVEELRGQGLPVLTLVVAPQPKHFLPDPNVHFCEPGHIAEGLAKLEEMKG
jgi:hypothetical protein